MYNMYVLKYMLIRVACEKNTSLRLKRRRILEIFFCRFGFYVAVTIGVGLEIAFFDVNLQECEKAGEN